MSKKIENKEWNTYERFQEVKCWKWFHCWRGNCFLCELEKNARAVQVQNQSEGRVRAYRGWQKGAKIPRAFFLKNCSGCMYVTAFPWAVNTYTQHTYTYSTPNSRLYQTSFANITTLQTYQWMGKYFGSILFFTIHYIYGYGSGLIGT